MSSHALQTPGRLAAHLKDEHRKDPSSNVAQDNHAHLVEHLGKEKADQLMAARDRFAAARDAYDKAWAKAGAHTFASSQTPSGKEDTARARQASADLETARTAGRQMERSLSVGRTIPPKEPSAGRIIEPIRN